MTVKSNLKLVVGLGIVLAIALLSLLLRTHLRAERERCLTKALSPLPRIDEILKNGKPVLLSPEFLAHVPKERLPQVPPLREILECRDAASFYRINRDHHFSAVFLGIRPSFLPLAKTLLASPLWILSDVFPGGYLFLPAGSVPWCLPNESSLKTKFPNPKIRAEWMIRTASSLIAIGYADEAEQLLAMAARVNSKTSLLKATQASLAASRGNWNEALRLSQEALRYDHGNLMAVMIEIRALTECNRNDEALDRARRLVAKTENQETLFLLARAANGANSSADEIESLQRLVSLSRSEGQPVGASLTYLGQAYAKRGDRGEALRTFQEAIATPELTDEQRRLLRGIMDHLMQGDTPSSSLPPLEDARPPAGVFPAPRP
jgi:tetratricopeptide (TPR) repeat protein